MKNTATRATTDNMPLIIVIPYIFKIKIDSAVKKSVLFGKVFSHTVIIHLKEFYVSKVK